MTSLTARPPVLVRSYAWLDAHARQVALAAVALSLLLAGGYALVLGDTLRYLDERVYVQLAGSLASGAGYSADGVQATAYRPPGYPFLLTPVHGLTGGDVLAMRFVGVLALAGCVWFGYRVGRRVFAAPAGALAAVVLACYPLLTYTATALYPQVPGLFLLLVTIDCGMSAVETRGGRRVADVVVAGLAGGLLVLTVPNFALSVVLVPVWMAWKRRGAWGAAAAVLALAVAVPGAWCVRNALALHAFVPVSTNDGINLLLGNSEHTTAGSGTEVDISRYEQYAKDHHLDEVGINRYFSDSAVDWITEHPGDAAVLYGEKLANTFSFSSDMATSGQGGRTADLVLALTYYPVLLLAVLRVGLARRWPLSRTETLLAVLVVLNFLLQAVFFTRLRFRVPLDGLTVLLAASVVVRFARGSRGA
ncbi:glycosyltransferase family 39 protein [Amycolatopsis sacchari]|uniref:glycosyltransferase family 39 protein n=1 Tax=Amycolatopsis sacchari TaxID=115433 RepID=UPI003D7370E2